MSSGAFLHAALDSPDGLVFAAELPPPHRYRKNQVQASYSSDEHKRIVQYKVALHREAVACENIGTDSGILKQLSDLDMREWRSVLQSCSE
jgi:hypothetical protein